MHWQLPVGIETSPRKLAHMPVRKIGIRASNTQRLGPYIALNAPPKKQIEQTQLRQFHKSTQILWRCSDLSALRLAGGLLKLYHIQQHFRYLALPLKVIGSVYLPTYIWPSDKPRVTCLEVVPGSHCRAAMGV